MKDYVAENERILNEWRKSNEEHGEKKFADAYRKPRQTYCRCYIFATLSDFKFSLQPLNGADTCRGQFGNIGNLVSFIEIGQHILVFLFLFLFTLHATLLPAKQTALLNVHPTTAVETILNVLPLHFRAG